MVPAAQFYQKQNNSKYGLFFFGTSQYSSEEAMDTLKSEGVTVDAVRLKAFPFSKEVENFIHSHDKIFVIEQNRDAQMRSLLMIELGIDPAKLISVLNYDGMPITAHSILTQIKANLTSKPAVKAASKAKPAAKKVAKKPAKKQPRPSGWGNGLAKKQAKSNSQGKIATKKKSAAKRPIKKKSSKPVPKKKSVKKAAKKTVKKVVKKGKPTKTKRKR
jgi:hypothetical protein